MEVISKNRFRLSSGREFGANEGIIGLGQADARWLVGEGYDGMLYGARGDEYDPVDNWTPEECRDLADYMIALWQEFKSSREFSQ